MLCDQYYLRSPDLVLQEMSSKLMLIQSATWMQTQSRPHWWNPGGQRVLAVCARDLNRKQMEADLRVPACERARACLSLPAAQVFTWQLSARWTWGASNYSIQTQVWLSGLRQYWQTGLFKSPTCKAAEGRIMAADGEAWSVGQFEMGWN